MKFIYTFASRGFSMLFAFFFSVMIARLLPQEDAGAYFTGLTIMAGLAIIIRMGFDNYIIRHNANESVDKLSSLLTFTLISLIIYIILMLTFTAILFLNQNLYEYINSREYLLYFLISSLFFALLWLGSGFLKSSNRAPLANFIELGLIPITLIIVYTVYAEYSNIISLQKAAQIYLIISCLLSLSIYIYLILIYRTEQKIELLVSFSKIKESANIMLAGLMDYFLMWFSALVLIWYVSMSDIAGFHVAVRLAVLISFILIVINSISAPVFANFFNSSQLDKVADALRISTSLMTLLALIPFFFFLFFSDFVLRLFGEGYQSASAELLILTIGQIINVISGSVGYILMMSGHSHIYKKTTFFGALTSIILALLLIPKYGTIGAAIATSFGISIKNLYGVYYVYHIHGIISFPSIKNMKKILTLKETFELFTYRN